nr:hypothetical protein [Cryobacterium sp. Y29]
MPWRSKSLRHLADELAEQGHRVSAPTVAGLLREESFSLQGNAKTIERGRHPGREAQFAHINAAAEEHLAAGQPLTSHEVIVNLIAGTTTRTGLTVTASVDDTIYPKGITITVCRFPPGTSKWNKIEHRRFSQINPELRVLSIYRP